MRSFEFPLQVFYDGACILCSAEMKRYQQADAKNRLRFIDISAPDFDADEYSRPREQLMKALHVRAGDGRFFTGVDAFLALYSALPEHSLYRLIGGFISLPGIKQVAEAGYAFVASHRHLLPRKKAQCETDACHTHR